MTGFGFYPENSKELLEGFKHGHNRVKLISRKDHSGSRVNSIGRDEVRGRETHLEAVSMVQVKANEILRSCGGSGTQQETKMRGI